MRADKLTVVTCIYNPIRWSTRLKHYERFKEHMLAQGVNLVVVECELGERPFQLSGDSRITWVGVRAHTLSWNKENLINIGLRHIPDDCRYVGWFDADIEFRRHDWAAETVHALQQYAVVQPWSEALDLGPKGEPMLVKDMHVQTSFAKVWRTYGDVKPWKGPPPQDNLSYAYPHPGYAWAIRRDVLNRLGGLIEASGLGAGDHQMAMSFVGKMDQAIHGQTTPEYQSFVRAWGERAWNVVRGNLGFVQATIEHNFHGAKEKRKYVDRWQILVKHKFNPITDIKRNLHGVIELSGNKPEMEMDFDRYFRSRDEDANILHGED